MYDTASANSRSAQKRAKKALSGMITGLNLLGVAQFKGGIPLEKFSQLGMAFGGVTYASPKDAAIASVSKYVSRQRDWNYNIRSVYDLCVCVVGSNLGKWEKKDTGWITGPNTEAWGNIWDKSDAISAGSKALRTLR